MQIFWIDYLFVNNNISKDLTDNPIEVDIALQDGAWDWIQPTALATYTTSEILKKLDIAGSLASSQFAWF